GNMLKFELAGEIAAALKSLALKTGTTMYMLLLAIFNIFLAKLSNREAIVTGTPVAGRHHADLEKIIGMFVNTLGLKNYPVGEKSFNGFLEEVKEKTLWAFENQDYPYEDLVKQAVVKRDFSRNPLFDVMFVLQNMDIVGMNIPGLKLSPYPYENKASKFDLTLLGMEKDDKLLFTFEYCTKLFKEETINRFILYFNNIVRDVIGDKTRRISAFEIITDEEKKCLLIDFNDTKAGYPKDKTIYRLFEEQAERIPDNIALVGASSQTCPHNLSYRQLNEQSNNIAGLLIEKGVLVDEVVGIKMERSIELIIGLLGILKSGCAYLPIDPELPQDRIDYMIKDSSAKNLLTAAECVFNFHHSSFILNGCPRRGLHHSNQLAYIIYTSGSTGKPKGVIIEHRSIVNTLCWRKNYYNFDCRDVVLQLPSFSFDSSVEDIFTPLISGSRLVLIKAQLRFDTGYLKKLIKMVGITHFLIVPSLYKTYLDEIPDSLMGMRSVTIAGEHFPGELIKRHFEKLAHVALYNEYGPTENSVCSTVYKFEPDTVRVLIGKPIDNTACFILDRYGLLVPLGVPGELWVGGVGIASGYLNNPELTANRFNSSYGSNKTYINYRTGDLARWLPNGNIEFLGRIDYQVKIRGFRIELGEIESRLLKCPGIREAVVIDRQNSDGKKYLCAYLVSSIKISASQVRDILAGSLPAYMIPSFFIQVEKIPLTPIGKIDRGALESYDVDNNAKKEYAAPQNEIEQKVAQIWKQVLKLEQLDIDENFFDLGGDSLDIIRINTKIMKEFNEEDTVIQLLRYPTVRSFSGYLGRGKNKTVSNNAAIHTVPLDKIRKARLQQKNKRI
ncbi:MAG TPA: amino acid adenylation domain-containing protein, partial [Candidatus Deferrimicrobium sp.]|nr:amino acid adenylation domain-containing protein [Candidatus Deferrimicrobium sp.]